MEFHPAVRSEQACYESSRLAVHLAHEYGTRLHIAHVTTARELDLFTPGSSVTGEAVIAHLYFTEADYATKKALIKCNPAIKTLSDRTALRKALTDGRIATIGTDHAPHEWKDKQGGCAKAASGMPMVQFSLVTMLELVDEGVLTLERMVELMAHQTARLFEVLWRATSSSGEWSRPSVMVVSSTTRVPSMPLLRDSTFCSEVKSRSKIQEALRS